MSVQPKKTRRKSAILRTFGSVNKRFYRFVQNSFIGRYLSGYDASCERLQKSVFSRLFSKWKKKRSPQTEAPILEGLPLEAEGIVAYEQDSLQYKTRDKFAEKFDHSKLVCTARKFKSMLLNTPVVTYGLVLFGFALFLLLSQALTLFLSLFDVPLGVLTYAVSDDTVLTVAYMVAAVVLMALSLVWVFAQNGSLAAFMFDSALIGSFLDNAMGLTQISKSGEKSKVIPRRSAFFIGALLGIVTFFATPHWFFVAFVVLVLVMIIVNIPEFGVIFTIFTLPYLSLFKHPTLIAVGLMTVITVSTILKLLRGKRTYKIDPLDIYVGLFLLLMTLSGAVSLGGWHSVTRALTMLMFGMIYFVIKSLISEEAWLKRCLSALMLSSIPVSILAILEFILGKVSNTWQDLAIFSELSGRATSLWGNPNILAEFLLVVFFVSLGALLAQKNAWRRLSVLLVLTVNLAALVFTWSRGAWIALFVAFIGVMLLYSHKALPIVIIGLLAFGAAFIFLPDILISRIESIVTFSDSSTLYRLHIWQGCAAMIRDTFWSGVGVGEEAFRAAYLPYALSGIENAPHSHNLVLQIVIELGIVGILVFLIMLVAIDRLVFTVFAKCKMKHSVSRYTLGIYGAFSALLLHGMTEYIWYNLRIYLLFFALIGLLAAARQIGNRTRISTVNEADCCDVDILLR